MEDFNSHDPRYTRLVDRYARYIESPVQRLRFLNSAMKVEKPRGFLERLPGLGSLPQRARLIVELSRFLPVEHGAPLGLRVTSLLYRLRFVVYALCALVVLSASASVTYVASRALSSLGASAQAERTGAAPDQAATGAAGSGGEAVAAIGSEAGLPLDKVWLADKGDGYEFYSNGARVLTQYETTGVKRRFFRYNLQALESDADGAGELQTEPLGIVYHVSESDLLPFAGSNNVPLQNRSKALLEYARAHRLYNYLIDRFGRTYRIVEDEYASNHAGYSLWSDGKNLYVNLNSSFIGICFEGKMRSGTAVGPDSINEAQIYAARVLTAVLRSRYGINDANCVTHGLVSVNPSNRLMGFHTDWVAGFPFGAIGLENKYETELIAISHLGFAYDQAYLAAAGGARWPGLERADAALKETANRNGLTIEEQRRAFGRIFQSAFLKQHALDQEKSAAEE